MCGESPRRCGVACVGGRDRFGGRVAVCGACRWMRRGAGVGGDVWRQFEAGRELARRAGPTGTCGGSRKLARSVAAGWASQDLSRRRGTRHELLRWAGPARDCGGGPGFSRDSSRHRRRQSGQAEPPAHPGRVPRSSSKAPPLVAVGPGSACLVGARCRRAGSWGRGVAWPPRGGAVSPGRLVGRRVAGAACRGAWRLSINGRAGAEGNGPAFLADIGSTTSTSLAEMASRRAGSPLAPFKVVRRGALGPTAPTRRLLPADLGAP